MGLLDDVPAIRRIDTNRADAYAFEIMGHVSAADIENLYGLLEGAYALHDKIDLLIRIVDYAGTDWQEVSTHTTTEGRSHALEHIRRCAAVGEPNWIPYARGIFTSSLPVELRHFNAADEQDAWAWIDALPVNDA